MGSVNANRSIAVGTSVFVGALKAFIPAWRGVGNGANMVHAQKKVIPEPIGMLMKALACTRAGVGGSFCKHSLPALLRLKV